MQNKNEVINKKNQTMKRIEEIRKERTILFEKLKKAGLTLNFLESKQREMNNIIPEGVS